MRKSTSERCSYFDLQVNGYGGVDFNSDELSQKLLVVACEQLAADGVTGFLATIITDDLSVMARRIRNLVALRSADPTAKQLIAGIHIEGPFISSQPGFVGAHSTEAVRPATVDAIEPLIEAGGGLVRLVTLAPESDSGAKVTRWLVDNGVTVSAGHSDASLDALKSAIENGLSMFTHLGNACPLNLHRHDNIIHRVLSLADDLWICFIADGVHVPFMALRNYIRVVGVDRSIIVSDAIAAAGFGPGEFTLGANKVVVDEKLATWSADRSHLVGSAVSMSRAHSNLVISLGMSQAEACQLTFENPRRAIGLAE